MWDVFGSMHKMTIALRLLKQGFLHWGATVVAAASLVSCSAKLNSPIENPSIPLSTNSGFTLSPTAQVVSINGTAQFSATGGTAPYSFDLYYGNGSVNSSNGVYIAPSVPGDAVVRATDATGQYAYAGVLVTDAPVISPATKTLAVGNVFTFSVSGGMGPYSFSLASGGGSVSSSSGEFAAPPSAGSTVVRVTDAKGRTSESTVTIVSALSISPKNVTVPVLNPQAFTASGGTGGLVYSVVSGGGAIDAASGVFSAPSATGMAAIKVQDSYGNFDLAFVTISNPLTINPPQITIAKNTNYSFSASGGKAPYTYSVPSAAHGSVVSTTGVYTAPSSAGGPFTVTVTDADSQTSQASITVTDSLNFSVPNVTLMVGDTFDFSTIVSGGVGTISYSVASAGGSFAGSVYTAPAVAGTYTVTAHDSQLPTPNSAQATVIVNSALAISPSAKSVSVGNVFNFSASGGVPPYTYSTDSGSIVASSGAFTAPSSAGSATVTVTDSKGHTAQATVTVNAALAISPVSKTMVAGSSHTFSASGGVSPHTFSIASGGGSVNSSSGAYTAPGATGTAKLLVTDSIGNTAESDITIVAALAISPSVISLQKDSGIVFSGSGGLAPYIFAVTSGGGTINASTGAYTAPSSAGSAVVRVTDSLGNTSDAAVTIYDGLAISPFTKTMIVSGSFTFSAAGGVTPYTYSVQSGGGAINASSGAYTAPGSAGSALIRVTDAQGNTSDASVTIKDALAIAPTTKTLAVNNTAGFAPSGGIPPYTFSVPVGTGTINASTGDYTAPASSGSATVRVTDSAGATADASVTINAAIAISPASWELGVGTSKVFSATGGVAPYTYSVSSGGGSFSGDTYTASGSAGTATVRVTDSLGNYSEAPVTIYNTLAIAPSSKTLTVNAAFNFSASGGVLPYTFSRPTGTGSVTAAGAYTAPAAAGSATIRVTDALGNTSDASVTVVDGLAISPSTKVMAKGSSFGFSASGGVAPYTYSVQNGGGSFSTATYTAPGTAGNAVVRVTDSLGSISEASVTIYDSLAISPSSKTLSINNVFTFTASGGVGPYTFSKFSGTGTVTSGGEYTAPGSSGSATIRVTDSLGNTSDATVTINAALAISPSSATVAAGGTQAFSGVNGVGPYTYSVVSGGGSFSTSTYTAPSTNAGASVSVRVTDSLGNTADGTITVPAITVAISAPTASDYIKSSNKAAFPVSGTCSENTRSVTVSATGGLNATPSCSGGAWNTTLNFTAVSDGSITITANHSNANSVAATQASVTLTKDATVPTVAIGSPVGTDYITNANKAAFTVSGSCSESGRTVSVSATGGVTATPNCSGTSWTTSLNLSAVSDGSITITADHQDAAGNAATQASVTLTKDVAINAPASIDDGTWWNSTSVSPTISWSTVTDTGTGLNRYEVAVGTSAGGNNVSDWVSTGTTPSKQFSGLSLTEGTDYYASVRAVDNAGNVSSVVQGNGWRADVTAPTAPGSITVGGAATNALRAIPTMTFASSTDTGGSGVAKYQIQIWNTSGPTLIRDWSDATTSGSTTLDYSEGSDFLPAGASLFVKIRAVDNAANASTSTTSGTWTTTTCTAGSQTFTYTGADQTFTVPTGCTSFTVKMWGAGGGGAYRNYGWGGGGAYAFAAVAATPGTDYTIIVGQGGGAQASPTYGGGGAGKNAGAGGGRSAIRLSSTELVTAAGGGGGGWNMRDGGAGGASQGEDGWGRGAGASDSLNGKGATSSGGGNGGTGGTVQNGYNGVQFQGGSATGSYGAGGGGGYYGGGSSATSTADVASGGGGSSYVAGAGVSGGFAMGGTKNLQGNATDSDNSGAGAGASVSGPGTTTMLQGAHGRVKIYYGPQVLEVSPNSGTTDGGTPITLYGAGFQSGTSVTIGGNACTSVTIVAPNTLTCLYPAASPGPADVVVSIPGASPITLSNAFTYFTAGTMKQTFTHTGGFQTFVVPGGINSIQVKMWGAGGSNNGTNTGGGGGYSTATYSVATGTRLTLLVGGGGGAVNNAGMLDRAFGGGGAGMNGGAGGGRSAIINETTEIMTAGGGGGAGWGTGRAGGVGGGETGGNGGGNSYSGQGGTQSAGGAAGAAGTAGSGTAGTARYGASTQDGYSGSAYFTGGGGGYYGGGGGSTVAADNAAGGGGSSYIGGSGLSGASTTSATGGTAGNAADPDCQGAGAGGVSGTVTGGNGKIVITY